MVREFRKKTFRDTECEDCGKIFNTWSHNAFRCPECRRKSYLEYLKKYNKKTKKKTETKNKRREPFTYTNYSQGTSYCKSYNNDDIQCVMCYEQRLKEEKRCYEWGENQK